MQLSDSLYSYWSTISHIPQDIFSVDDSLEKNIALGVNDHEIDELKINTSLCQARLDEVVNELPDKQNTLIGERGIKLSGGQRQRIALARAFSIFEKQFIILDEATSSLDSETENQIMKEINNLKRKKTFLIIKVTSTPTLQNCDRIIMLENGKIKKQGTYNDFYK